MTATDQKGPSAERLRKAITDSQLSLYRIAKDASVPYSSLHRFVHGSTLSLMLFEKLCQHLGLKLTKGKD